jgi:hypothetical protein
MLVKLKIKKDKEYLAAKDKSKRNQARISVCIPERDFTAQCKEDYSYGLGRMYKVFREEQPKSMKIIEVFRTHREALRWLGRAAGDQNTPVENNV